MQENENRSADDLTEDATPQRIEEYRQKGNVAQSREISGMLGLVAAGSLLTMMMPRWSMDIMDMMRDFFHPNVLARLDLATNHMLHDKMLKAGKVAVTIAGSVGVVAALVGSVGSFVQVGPIFTFEPIQPDFEKINFLRGIQKIFSMRQLFELLRIVLKTFSAVAICYYFVSRQMSLSLQSIWLSPESSFAVLQEQGAKIFFALSFVLLLFAGVDFVLQRMEYLKNVKMTKQEAKQEHKEQQGDPQVRARIRAAQRQMARRRMVAAVKTADVIVTNPTHFAVAISYDKEKMSSPKVVAKGADFLAERIKKMATSAGVPLVENVFLARTLYKTVKVNHVIPKSLYQAVAEVLAYVYKLKKKL